MLEERAAAPSPAAASVWAVVPGQAASATPTGVADEAENGAAEID